MNGIDQGSYHFLLPFGVVFEFVVVLAHAAFLRGFHAMHDAIGMPTEGLAILAFHINILLTGARTAREGRSVRNPTHKGVRQQHSFVLAGILHPVQITSYLSLVARGPVSLTSN
jgi:hypothetical protein